MTKPVRSPILGYNHNIQFHGHVFHVQTEDSGAQHARLFTHLFVGGTILASKKHEYDPEAPEDAVRLLMQRLHKSMIKELKEGVHDPRIQGFFAARGEQVKLGDRPSLIQMPAVTDGAGTPAPPAVAAAPPAPAPASQLPVDDRPVAVSGSIETASPPRPAVARTPPPVTTTPPPARKVVVVKPPEIKRPPVVVSSSAEGVVVKRNVVINVGGGAAPVQGQISRGTAMPRPAPRPAVPYVVREGSFPLPTASRGTGGHPAPPPSDITPSARDIRMPWDAPGGASDAPPPVRTRTPGAPSDHTPTGRAIEHTPTSRVMGSNPGMRTRSPVPPSERTPSERAFNADLPNDKSLDEVILEYLSDDAE
ncbi:MAG TPA: hypothetical protein VHL80_17165 [Polyangia bacterium]|nr:hypothetical protein [Polyangia bacterium]